MRNHLLLTTILAAPLLIAATGPSAGPSDDPKPAATKAPETVPHQGQEKPRFGDYGFDEAGMDRTTAPGDNFFYFANGTWAKNTEIPSDKSNYGAFNLLSDLSQTRTRGILEEARQDPSSRIGIAYASYLDTAAINAKGLAPIQPWLNEIKATTKKTDLPKLFAAAARNGVGTPLAAWVRQDNKNPDVYITAFYQSGLGMPDRDYYLSAEEKLVSARAAYLKYLTNMLTLAGEPNAASRAAAIVAFETEIAKVHWTRVDSRDSTKTYNKMTVAELAKRAPGFDFGAMLKAGGVNADSVLVAQPSAYTGIAALIAKTPINVVTDQLLVRSLGSFADVLPEAFDKEAFAFSGTVLSGTPEQEARWKRSVDFTVDAISDEVSKVYVARYFPPETKAAVDSLVKNVIAAMGERIDKLDWMAPQTKVKAHEKLAAFTPKIGYPDRWHDYSGLQIVAGDAFGNKLRANQWSYADMLSRLGQPIRRWEWGMTPMQVNAYANFGMVEIVFPAAILQAPFFDPAADDAINYGGIGAVIGHELSHHFDDQGAKYNAEGRLTDWWTPADVAAFKERTDALVAQYNLYEALPGKNVNGALTLGENTADLAGLAVAYDAYKKSLGGKPAPVINGTTGDQRFYLGWAQVWRRKYREANLLQRLMTDTHSPSEQRAAVVRNLDPWYDAFKPTPEQKLYLPKDKRVKIW